MAYLRVFGHPRKEQGDLTQGKFRYTGGVIKRLLLVVLLTLIFAGLWNIRLLVQVAKPQILSLTQPETAKKLPETVADNTLVYPRLGINTPIQEKAASSPMDQKDWAQMAAALRQGISLNYTEADFSQSRLSFLTGHSSDTYPHAYSAVFSPLGQAEVGDTFALNNKGTTSTYKVIDKKILNPADKTGYLSYLSPDPSIQRVELVTCWPLFSTSKRLVVVGEKVAKSD